MKPKGWAILEKIGDRDKWELKQYFTDDENGSRGQYSGLKDGELVERYNNDFSRFQLDSLKVNNGIWPTYYTREELIMMLQQTPTVRDFDPQNDADAVDKYIQDFTRQGGIVVYQNRILICMHKY